MFEPGDEHGGRLLERFDAPELLARLAAPDGG
ncbi:DNA polymerase III subunit beta, partial [Streptomyces sp. 150FB]